MNENEEERITYEQPKTQPRRAEIARTCAGSLKLTMPCVVDTLDDAVDAAYAAWPERMFVVDAAGRIAYAGKPGPWGFKPEEVEEWLSKNVGAKEKA